MPLKAHYWVMQRCAVVLPVLQRGHGMMGLPVLVQVVFELFLTNGEKKEFVLG